MFLELWFLPHYLFFPLITKNGFTNIIAPGSNFILNVLLKKKKKEKKIEKEKNPIIALRQLACIHLDLILTILHTGIYEFVNVGFLT